MRSKTMTFLGLIFGCGIAILAAGCGSNGGGSPTTETGTIHIEVDPAGLAAPWRLIGPSGFDEQDTGDGEFSEAPAGSYTLTWGALDNWSCESAPVQTQQLAGNGSIVFNGLFESLAGGLTVIQPSLQSVWRLNQSDVEIRWLGGDDQQQVTLSLYNQGVLVANIANQIANSGEFLTWDIPSNLVSGNGYRLQVTQGTLEYWSAEFRVGPAVEIISPDAETTWGIGSEVLIAWGSAQSGGTAQIDLYREDLLISAIATAAPNSGSFLWDVPSSLTAANDYRVRLLIGSLEVFSPAFTISQESALHVSEPTSATLWRQGQSDVTVTWSGGDVGQSVDLYLDRAGSPVATIATSTQNDGTHTSWDVPAMTVVGSGYRVRVVQGTLEAQSAEFSIQTSELPLTVVEPTATTVWQPGQSNVPINWTGGDAGQVVSLYLHHGGAAVATIASNTANDGSHTTWDVPSGMAPGTGYQVRLVQGAGDAMSDEFSIQGAITPLAIVVPNTGVAWSPGQQNVLVTWTGGDPALTVEITLYKGDAQVATIAAATTNDGVDDAWDVPANQSVGNDYRVRVLQGSDADFSDYFLIDSTLPLEVTQPALGATWNQDQQDVTITWNGGDPTQPVSIYLYKSTLQVAAVVTDTPNDGSHTTWDVPEGLVLGTDYRIQVAQGADDDFSDYFQVAPPPLLVMQPTGATIWRRGQQNVLISWTGGNPGQVVSIYLNKGGTRLGTITTSAANTGEYSIWDVPVSQTIGNDYQVQVVQGSLADTSEEFAIAAPLLVISQPGAATVWQPGQADVPITWTGGNPALPLSLLLLNGSTPVATIEASTSNDGSHNTWDVPTTLPFATSYRVQAVQGEDTAYSAYLQIGQPPLQVTSPNSASVCVAGEYTSVTWTGGDPNGLVSLYLHKSGDQVATLASGIANFGSQMCWLPSNLAADDDYRVRVAQGADYDYSDYFTINAATPQLQVTEPDTFTVWNPGQQNVLITWTGGNPAEPVSIELRSASYDSLTIATSTPNDGTHSTWDVPPGVTPGNNYWVRIRQGYRSGDSNRFQIGLTVTSVGHDEYRQIGQQDVPITWIGGLPGQPVDLELYRGESFIMMVTTGAVNDGIWTWDIPTDLDAAQDYHIRIRQGDSSARGRDFGIGPEPARGP